MGGESKDGNTVVADTGMKESQSEEDNISDLESSGKPNSLELPEGVEESLNNGEEKEEDHNLENGAEVLQQCHVNRETLLQEMRPRHTRREVLSKTA